jgi:hypothetical protein
VPFPLAKDKFWRMGFLAFVILSGREGSLSVSSVLTLAWLPGQTGHLVSGYPCPWIGKSCWWGGGAQVASRGTVPIKAMSSLFPWLSMCGLPGILSYCAL